MNFVKLMDFLFPPRCLVCKSFTKKIVCNDCEEKAFSFYGEASELDLPIPYLALFRYTDQLKILLEKLKYDLNKKPLELMQNQLIKAMPNFGDIDYIVPIPLNPKRFAERGFNQAELLIEKFALLANIPIRHDIVYREENTIKMHTLSKHEREANIKETFKFWSTKKGDVTNKTILIFDDIITTGSTIKTIADLLAELKPKRLIAVAFSRPTVK